jgi:hypothetical protein
LTGPLVACGIANFGAPTKALAPKRPVCGYRRFVFANRVGRHQEPKPYPAAPIVARSMRLVVRMLRILQLIRQENKAGNHHGDRARDSEQQEEDD